MWRKVKYSIIGQILSYPVELQSQTTSKKSFTYLNAKYLPRNGTKK